MVLGKNKPLVGGTDAWNDDRIEVIGRYTLHIQIGVGGMATVCLGWVSGAADFARVVAIKRMHPQFARDEQFAVRFRDEAWLSSRLLHPNIVQVLDIVERSHELLIVMEYVHGVSLGGILEDAAKAGSKVPTSVVAGIFVPALHGLHAAHEATDDDGHAIGIVHRDFSPQNIMVSSEGQAKILDFGIAKAKTHLHVTSSGLVSGKFGYISPEQALAGAMDRRTDVFAAGIVLWEMLACERLFGAPDLSDAAVLHRVLTRPVQPPSSANPAVPSVLDDLVLHALDRDPDRRFASARMFALALESATEVASPSTVAEWIERTCAKRLERLSHTLNRTRLRMRQEHLGVTPATPASQAIGAASKAEAEPDVTVAVKLAPPRSRTRWTKVVAVAALLLVLALVLLIQSRLPGEVSTAPAESRAPSANRVPRVSPLSQPRDEAPIAAETVPEPRTEPMDAQAKSPGAHVKARPGKSHSHSNTRRSHSQTASPGMPDRSNCDPPTYLDSDGIRIFKEECL
jgi:serine/threonine-protein kinase